jgi:hypothetical protein
MHLRLIVKKKRRRRRRGQTRKTGVIINAVQNIRKKMATNATKNDVSTIVTVVEEQEQK